MLSWVESGHTPHGQSLLGDLASSLTSPSFGSVLDIFSIAANLSIPLKMNLAAASISSVEKKCRL